MLEIIYFKGVAIYIRDWFHIEILYHFSLSDYLYHDCLDHGDHLTLRYPNRLIIFAHDLHALSISFICVAFMRCAIGLRLIQNLLSSTLLWI